MNPLERHIEKVRALRASELPKVAAGSGVGLQTLREIKYGRNGRKLNPRLDTLTKLAEYFRGRKA